MKNKKIIITSIAILIMAIAIVMVLMLTSKTNENGNGNDNNLESTNTSDIGEFNDSNVELNILGVKYTFPFKLSDFINNGWKLQSSYKEELLDKTVDYIVSLCDSELCYGFNFLSLEKDNLRLNIFFDTSITNIKVAEADIIDLKVEKINEKESAEFNFNGINLGTKLTKSEIKRIFGTENYSISDDSEYYTYTYYKMLNDQINYSLVFVTDIKNDKLISFGIGIN